MLALTLGLIVRCILLTVGIVGLLRQIQCAIRWIQHRSDPERSGELARELQRATLVLVVYIATMSAIVIGEQVLMRGEICIGLTCPITYL